MSGLLACIRQRLHFTDRYLGNFGQFSTVILPLTKRNDLQSFETQWFVYIKRGGNGEFQGDRLALDVSPQLGAQIDFTGGVMPPPSNGAQSQQQPPQQQQQQQQRPAQPQQQYTYNTGK